MSKRRQSTLISPQINLQLHCHSELILQLSLHNQMAEAILLRPTLDDWLVDDGQIIAPITSLEPAYIYLFPGGTASFKLGITVPSLLPVGTILKSWLRFPGVLTPAIPIQLQVISSAQQKNQSQVVEFPVVVTFPPSGDGTRLANLDQTTGGIINLISRLIDLDKIPSRWLGKELLVLLCQKGEEYSQTQSGRNLLNRLRCTRFFQNGVIAFTQAQIPQWLCQSLTTTQAGQKGILESWEQWLLSLAQTDLEVGESNREICVPPLLIDDFASKVGMSADRWFAGIVLGLALVSPQIANIINAIATQSPDHSVTEHEQAIQVTYSLTTGLPLLDLITARWLVVELLLILAQKGDEYAQTTPGSQLLNQLSRTRFGKNGIIAFASAQIPRWLLISQSAAQAYQASQSNQMQPRGLLAQAQAWLWSLIPKDFHLGQINNTIFVPDASMSVFVAEMGMDAQRWFLDMILGLSLVSPRIAAILNAIAALAPTPSTQTPPAQIILSDVLGEDKPILR